MKKETISSAEEAKKQQEHQELMHQIAAELEVKLDEGAQYFVVTSYDENGKEVTNKLPAWKEIPLQSGDTVNVKEAIEARKKYPTGGLKEAIQKLRRKGI